MIDVHHIGLGVHICRPTKGNGRDVFLMKYSAETMDFVWPTVEDWLKKTIESAPPWWTIEDLYLKCKRGDLIIWIACVDNKPLGVLLTGLDTYAKARVVGVPWIGGTKMRLWIEAAQEIIETWAKAAGCAYMTGSGRAGWAKIIGMEDYGPTLIKKL